MNPIRAVVELFLPRTCHICGECLLSSEEFVCGPCASKFPLTGYERYWTDRKALNSDLNPMEMRFAGQIPLGHACAPYFYTRDSALSSLVHDFKYRGFPKLARSLGKRGGDILKSSGLFDGVELLLPVPLHWTKRLRRGYCQTELIATGLSDATGIPVGRQLKAVRAHRTQTSLNTEQRLANTRGVFSVTDPDSLRGRHVMLVDDICTTGATLLSAASVLLGATENSLRISIFTLGVV